MIPPCTGNYRSDTKYILILVLALILILLPFLWGMKTVLNENPTDPARNLIPDTRSSIPLPPSEENAVPRGPSRNEAGSYPQPLVVA